MAKHSIRVSAFFPAHNEVDNIGPLTEKTVRILSEQVQDFEVIIVNDGSRDGTRERADELAQIYPQVRAVHHDVNRGYGGAVKTGIASCAKDWIFFTDGDGQFDVGEIPLLLEHAAQFDAVVGYRLDRQDPFHRKLFAFCWGTLIRILFGFRVKDLDCAFKLMKREYFDGVELKAEGAVITVELFSILTRNRARIRQVGVHHYPRTAGEQSGGSVKVIARAFKELLLLYKRLKT
ncbi:MAG: glycosyltransferase family 2 protein [Candidatus Omnitrophota bacterium]|jgi:glycosyltransferase involved in cell wall biosynthesis|nr:MAG: glycosyltransferase family 2 protein [Candidatus Omnitrophota bacterium]